MFWGTKPSIALLISSIETPNLIPIEIAAFILFELYNPIKFEVIFMLLNSTSTNGLAVIEFIITSAFGIFNPKVNEFILPVFST